MTKLADLHPEFGASGDGRWWLQFDCQTTPGGRVQVYFHRGAPQPGFWQCTSEFRLFAGLEHLGEQPVIGALTLVPSIGDHHCKSRERCPGHVTIINGEVLP